MTIRDLILASSGNIPAVEKKLFWENLGKTDSYGFGLGIVSTNANLYRFGGRTVSAPIQYTNVMQRYDASTNTWTNVTQATPPSPRYRFGICALDNVVFLYGGFDSSNVYKNDYFTYNPATQVWSFWGNYSTARLDMSIVGIGANAFVFGGLPSTGIALNTCSKYSNSTKTWVNLANIPVNKCAAGIVNVDGTKILLIGGGASSSEATNDVYEYDIITNGWTKKNNFPVTVRAGVAFKLGPDIFHVGGFQGLNLRGTYKYNPVNDSWEDVTDDTSPWIIPGSFWGTAAIDNKQYFLGNYTPDFWACERREE